MCSPFRLARLTAAAVSTLALMSCASLNVNSYVERGVNFTRYQTYSWGPGDSQSTGDPRLDSNPFFFERIQADVEKQLATRGFGKTTSGRPDLLIHVHASINQRIDVNDADREYSRCDGCRPFAYEAGTLLLDFVDTRTNKVVWRGWAEGSVDGVIDNQEWMEQKIDDAVTRILERFPRRL